MSTRYTVVLKNQQRLEEVARYADRNVTIRTGDGAGHFLDADKEVTKRLENYATIASACEPYYVNEEITRLLEDAADSWEDAPFDLSTLPTETGFVYFDGLRGFETCEVALTGGGLRGDTLPAVMLGLSWVKLSDRPDVALLWYGHMIDSSVGNRLTVPNCLLRTTLFAGETIEHTIEDMLRTITVQSFTSAMEGRARKMCVMMQSLWAFMQQRLCIRRKSPVDRPMRRRMERDGIQHIPEIEIVELRARDYQQHPQDGYTLETTGPDWSCRWIVRRHWRRQYYPSIGAHRRILIEAYSKGPPDKELKTTPKLFAVVR